ncbi:NAC domain-containing protein 45-like [Vigna unguiculata]|uniref:NAC domain-containing protein 45-like n=1 Tax=Vigna unguiculata TaxID=3917 RepID=UPI001015F738|nr:NAC domain-containing protein 45-like [Vigna unguiculata]
MNMAPVSLPPGFRFHPTDEELVSYYLKRKINGRKIELEIIPEVDLYKCEPWDLPGKSLLPGKDLEWYFFSPRDRKYPNGSRTNRATKSGYWKATGKDRKVNSQSCAIGMKKTLVYYRGRAPHGCRTGWVMHEYRLDETQCETNTGLQDAYALCRVFKKTAVIPPKVGDQHYVNVTNQIIASDQSSSINELYSEGRGEVLESSNYFMSLDTCPSSNINVNTFNNINGGRRDNETTWSHFLSEDLLNLPTTSTSSFPNYGSMSYPPSKVDVALECARMQHRFSMPPLQMQDLEFPQVGISKLKMAQASSSMSGTRNETDILQEILSVAHASQELINQSNYSSQPFMNANENFAPHESDFTFMVGTNYNHVNDMNTMGFVDKAWEDQNTRSIEIGDLDDGFKTENLRWMGMSSKNVGKSFIEEQQNIVPIDDISNFQTNTEGNEMKGFEKHSCNKEITDTEIDDFSMGFMNDEDPNENLLNEENIDYSNSTNFDVVEETKTNHGMFVSTHQVADTFFHQVAPSQTLKVQLNPVMAGNQSIENATVSHGASFFRKFKAYATGKLRKPSNTIASAVEFIFALLLMHCVLLKEFVEDWKSDLKHGGSVYTMKRMREASETVTRNEEEKVWLVGMKYGKGFSMILKKISIFLTISLALFTMWANHIIVDS